MGVGEAGWWGRGDRSHQHGEVYLCCFKEKEVWERREEGIKNARVREGHRVPTTIRQHMKKRPVRKRQLQS